jgi:hypothetical protein
MNNQNKKQSIELLNSLPYELAMTTKVWGPPAWFFLHSIAMAYPKKIDEDNPRHIEIKKKMYNFLSSLGFILPCPICGDSYNNYIKQKDYQILNHLDSRQNLTYFLYKIHNKVNEKLGVPDCDIPSYYEVLKYYSRFIAGSPCVATTEKEREQKKNQMCKKNNFKKYKCIVNVLDTYNHMSETMNKESFKDINNKNLKIDIFHILLIVIIIILLLLCFFKNN